MAKKDLRYYRWQFLSRNKDYRELFMFVRKKYPELLNKALNEQSPLLVEQRGPITWDEPRYSKEWVDRIRKLRKKFSINGFFDPQLQNPPTGLKIYGPYDDAVRLGRLRRNFLRELQAGQSIKGAFLIESIKRDDPSGIININKAVEVSINCDANWATISSELKKIIDSIQKRRRKVLGLSRAKKAKATFRKQELERYLWIYDLREVKGKRNRQVAKMMYPTKTTIDGLRYAEVRVSEQYNEAKALVQGGYRQLLF